MKRYSNVMATISVFIALGGGAYAATVVGRAKVADNALRLGGVAAKSYDQAAMGGLNTTKTSLPNKGTTPLIEGTLFNSGRAGAGFMTQADVNVTNNAGEPATLTLLLALNHKVEAGEFTATIQPGSSLSVPALFAYEPKCKKCGGLTIGNNEVQLLGG